MFTNPLHNLKNFELKDDMVLVDLGAGTGFYSIFASDLLPLGKVYAIEINKDFVEIIRSKIKDLKNKNVEVFWGNVEKKEGTHLANHIADRIIISNLLFQIEDKDAFLNEVNRIMKKEGKILFIDYNIHSLFYKKHKEEYIKKEDVISLFGKHRFIFEKEIDVGKYHYGIIFNKAMS